MYINNLASYNYYALMQSNRITSSQNSFPFMGSSQNTVIGAINSGNIYGKYGAVEANFDNVNKLSATTTIKTDAENLSNSAKAIKEVFNERTAVSEDATKVTASAEKGAINNSTYTLEVNQLAKAQINTGNTLDKRQVSAVNIGTNTISLKIGNAEKDINFTATAGDTNEVVLNKMMKAINDGKTGVTAAVVNHTDGIKLQLTSNNTGENSKFTITDKVGNATASTGLNIVTTTAVNAEYKINNIVYTSESNNVTTDRGKVTLNLKNIASDAVKVRVKSDNSKISESISNFVTDYNTLVNDAKLNSITSNSIKGMAANMKKHKANLEKVGITLNDDNTLSIDKNKLAQTVETNNKLVKDTFTAYQGVAEKVENLSKSLAQNPFTATGINTLDVYNKGMIMSYSYLDQGSILNLYR
jgi:flagellar hook-associated protein 2